MQVIIRPGNISGTVQAPPSKSLSHRAILCAALSDGKCRISHIAYSQDVNATLGAAERIGCKVEREPDAVTVTPAGGFATVVAPIDCGESGSTLRFFIPLMSLTGQKIRFTGRGRLMERPQQIYADLLPAHGARFTQDENGITVFGSISAGSYELPGNVSSQFISGLLFALPLLQERSTLRITGPVESRSYIELTRAVQEAFGVESRWSDRQTLRIPGGQYYSARDMEIEGDYSQAAFLAVLGAVTGGITIENLAPDSMQGDRVILDVLERCGAKLSRAGSSVTVSAADLTGTETDLSDCPDLGPILMVLGALCGGKSTITHAGRLRLKESDRVAAMQQELAKFGVALQAEGETVTVTGGGVKAPEETLNSHNDHRIAMSLAVLALAAGVPVTMDGAEAVAKSWPGFWQLLRNLGAEVTEDA